MNWEGHFSMGIANVEDLLLFIRFNSTYDTITHGSGAFNHNDIHLWNERRFVKEN